jgi:hypothetical protein
MLTFYGFEIELFVEKVLARHDGPCLCCARDWTARRWLIVRVAANPDHLAWLCVPVSERVMAAVLSGRAAPRDAVQHSATGTVEVVIVDCGSAVPDRCIPCADIPEAMLPAYERGVLSAA